MKRDFLKVGVHVGSISATLSCLFYPPREEPSGEECGLISLTAAGNQAYKVHVNRSEIWSNIKKELLGLKWVGNTTRQLTPPPNLKESPRLVGDCLVTINQFFTSNLLFSSISPLLWEKISLSQNSLTFTQNRQTVVNEISREI